MAPIPRPAGELTDRRYAARRVPDRYLPAAGYDGTIPPAPAHLADVDEVAYVELWRSPAAAAWLDSDAALVAELVELRRLTATSRSRGEYPPGTATARMTTLEDRLALSPKARAALRLKVVDDIPDADAFGDGVDYSNLPVGVRR
jgi:hypothetical protein